MTSAPKFLHCHVVIIRVLFHACLDAIMHFFFLFLIIKALYNNWIEKQFYLSKHILSGFFSFSFWLLVAWTFPSGVVCKNTTSWGAISGSPDTRQEVFPPFSLDVTTVLNDLWLSLGVWPRTPDTIGNAGAIVRKFLVVVQSLLPSVIRLIECCLVCILNCRFLSWNTNEYI